MAIRQRLLDSEDENLPEDIDDLDAAYVKQLKDAGMDSSLVNQFLDIMQELKEEEDNK